MRAEAIEAVKCLRFHIKADCLTDPVGLPIYFRAAKVSATGSCLHRCVRGTNNDIEGYHLHIRLLMAWCITPGLVHLLLVEQTYRWNLRQAIKNRGVDPAVGWFNDQPVLEAIEVMFSARLLPGVITSIDILNSISFVLSTAQPQDKLLPTCGWRNAGGTR